VAELRRVYDLGLEQGPFEGLIVSTRPDCLDRERAELLAGYREQGLDVWVELGLQSSNDRTLKRIQRGHTAAQFARAATICKDHGILTAAHVMLGLPGESERDAVQTSVFLDKVGIDAVKFHNLVIVEGTQLYREYLEGRATAPEAKTYLGLLISALERLPRHVVVMRLTCDPPSDAITIPGEMPEKFSFVQQLAKTMMARETWQGRTLDTR
jgi:radical SAM protein (TIGR01212 family)